MSFGCETERFTHNFKRDLIYFDTLKNIFYDLIFSIDFSQEVGQIQEILSWFKLVRTRPFLQGKITPAAKN